MSTVRVSAWGSKTTAKGCLQRYASADKDADGNDQVDAWLAEDSVDIDHLVAGNDVALCKCINERAGGSAKPVDAAEPQYLGRPRFHATIKARVFDAAEPKGRPGHHKHRT